MKCSTVLVADDHAVVVEGLRRILDRPEFEVVGVVADGRALLQAAARLRPDVIITDIAMPSLNGIDAAREILKKNTKAKIIFLTMHPEVAYATAALESGASGFVVKTSAGDELLKAIRQVLSGRIYISGSIAKSLKRAYEVRPAKTRDRIGDLTHRQREVLQLLAEGRQAKEIAVALGISSRTAEFHKYRIMNVLGVHTIAELARYALNQRMVE